MLDGRHTCPQPIWLFLALFIYFLEWVDFKQCKTAMWHIFKRLFLGYKSPSIQHSMVIVNSTSFA